LQDAAIGDVRFLTEFATANLPDFERCFRFSVGVANCRFPDTKL
jgi:hypothetical protein